jgi:hypothetical protein
MVFSGKPLYQTTSGGLTVTPVTPDSETGRFMGRHAVGLVVPPEEPGSLARAIRFLLMAPRKPHDWVRTDDGPPSRETKPR